jgi:hypothetical protein
MQQDQPDGATSTTEEVEDSMRDEPILTRSAPPAAISTPTVQRTVRFNWPGVGVVVIIGAIFAALAHLTAQPAASLVPAAVLSATGCGLLITGLRKLRTFKGAGLFEAALSGLLLALFQFITALSFPGVTHGLSLDQASQPGFFTTWELVAVFTTLFSMIGATLGHLAFAPLRPLPLSRARAKRISAQAWAAKANGDDALEQTGDVSEQTKISGEQKESEESAPLEVAGEIAEKDLTARSTMSYMISIVLLGLAPFLVGYVFAAAFDVALNFNQYDPGPFPTLRLLSALLPWQVPLNVDLQSLNLILAWRIPFLPGNPALFDIQAIEPFILNAAGLACTLLALFSLEQHTDQSTFKHTQRNLLLLEALLGLMLVLPANLWIAFGLHGLLQTPTIAVLLRTLQLLNPLTFTLNLITGPLVCIIVGAVIIGVRHDSTNYSQ